MCSCRLVALFLILSYLMSMSHVLVQVGCLIFNSIIFNADVAVHGVWYCLMTSACVSAWSANIAVHGVWYCLMTSACVSAWSANVAVHGVWYCLSAYLISSHSPASMANNRLISCAIPVGIGAISTFSSMVLVCVLLVIPIVTAGIS